LKFIKNNEGSECPQPSAPLYPELSAEPASVFRLQKISEIEALLRTEVENRERLHKKYNRAVNSLDGTCGMLGTTCVVTGTVGAGLLASGIGFVARLVLETVTGVAGLLDIAGVVVSRRCLAEAAKHKAVFSYWLQQNLTQSTATSRRLWKTVIFPMMNTSLC